MLIGTITNTCSKRGNSNSLKILLTFNNERGDESSVEVEVGYRRHHQTKDTLIKAIKAVSRHCNCSSSSFFLTTYASRSLTTLPHTQLYMLYISHKIIYFYMFAQIWSHFIAITPSFGVLCITWYYLGMMTSARPRSSHPRPGARMIFALFFFFAS